MSSRTEIRKEIWAKLRATVKFLEHDYPKNLDDIADLLAASSRLLYDYTEAQRRLATVKERREKDDDTVPGNPFVDAKPKPVQTAKP